MMIQYESPARIPWGRFFCLLGRYWRKLTTEKLEIEEWIRKLKGLPNRMPKRIQKDSEKYGNVLIWGQNNNYINFWGVLFGGLEFGRPKETPLDIQKATSCRRFWV